MQREGKLDASHDYVTVLELHQIRISMSRPANPWDNATCESFMKTLRCEEVVRSDYRNRIEARARISDFLDQNADKSFISKDVSFQGWILAYKQEAAGSSPALPTT